MVVLKLIHVSERVPDRRLTRVGLGIYRTRTHFFVFLLCCGFTVIFYRNHVIDYNFPWLFHCSILKDKSEIGMVMSSNGNIFRATA